MIRSILMANCLKKLSKVSIFTLLALILSITLVGAVSRSDNIVIASGYGTAKETVKITVTLATINKPKYEYTNKTGTSGISYRFSGITNTETKDIKGDVANYKVTAKATWIDSNYTQHYQTNSVSYKYTGTLTKL